jgi:hypothetical protein
MIGPTIRHGPHHAAQKSTKTGLSDCKTTSSNVASVISKAISIHFYDAKIVFIHMPIPFFNIAFDQSDFQMLTFPS